MHQIKPWFTGRLDFAPGLSFAGDTEFPLHGAAVGWFLDRKCATYVFGKGPHKITLLVMPAAGLDWPKRYQARERGFETLLWREGDLAYALVSDTEASELAALASRLTRK
jgi:anti-sigma factor RsiW